MLVQGLRMRLGLGAWLGWGRVWVWAGGLSWDGAGAEAEAGCGLVLGIRRRQAAATKTQGGSKREGGGLHPRHPWSAWRASGRQALDRWPRWGQRWSTAANVGAPSINSAPSKQKWSKYSAKSFDIRVATRQGGG